MPHSSPKARDYRRKAATCDSFADCAQSSADRVQLVRMRNAWLARAANADLLDGRPPPPPAKPNAPRAATWTD